MRKKEQHRGRVEAHDDLHLLGREPGGVTFKKKKTESGRSVSRDELTCVEEGGDGHAADQVLQQQALSGDQDGHKGRQRVVEGQVAHLKKGARR